MKFLSARAGAVLSSSVFNCFEKRGTEKGEQKRGNRSERHRANSPTLQEQTEVFLISLHYFRKTFSTPFCIELTIASTYSTLLIKSKSSMSWLTEPFDFDSQFQL